jgi:hypothetical protein
MRSLQREILQFSSTKPPLRENRPMMIQGAKSILLLFGLAALASGSPIAVSARNSDAGVDESDSPAGVWTGTAQVNSREVPFRLEISGSGDQLQAALVNGKERSPASSGSYSAGHLVLHFDYYANTIDATIEHGTLTGTFGSRGRSVPIAAERDGKAPVADTHPPRIGGAWEVVVDSGAKGEHTWKLRARQMGPNVDAVIERIDGDTGNLYGVWRDDAFEVSHFTAAGPNFATLRPPARWNAPSGDCRTRRSRAEFPGPSYFSTPKYCARNNRRSFAARR